MGSDAFKLCYVGYPTVTLALPSEAIQRGAGWSGGKVRRYFFHLENGVAHDDDEGMELADLEAAKCAAVKLIAETVCDHPGRFWKTESYQVTCADEAGLTLFRIQMVATLAPAAPAQR